MKHFVVKPPVLLLGPFWLRHSRALRLVMLGNNIALDLVF